VAPTRSKISGPLRWLRWAGWFLLSIVGAVVAGLAGCDLWVDLATWGRIHDQLADVAPAPVALLLGTSPRYAGRPNLFYQTRIKAARELFASGKVAGIIVSGDNRRTDYNEPARMRADLVKAGVPGEFITLDLAGVRTLDSVARAKLVFQQHRIIIVSQRFHAQRAVFIAQHFGLVAEAYTAEEPPMTWRERMREVLARVLACLDVWVLNRQPQTLGHVEPVKLRQPFR
jgi:SanA protein